MTMPARVTKHFVFGEYSKENEVMENKNFETGLQENQQTTTTDVNDYIDWLTEQYYIWQENNEDASSKEYVTEEFFKHIETSNKM